MNTYQAKTTPPLENEVVLQLLEQRLLQVNISLVSLRNEHGKLVKAIGETTNTAEIIPYYQKKWKEHQLRINAVLKQYMKLSARGAKDEPIVSEIRLRKTVEAEGDIFDWEIIVRDDSRVGNHFQVVSINSSGLPGAFPESEPYIEWLAEQKFITIETKSGPSNLLCKHI